MVPHFRTRTPKTAYLNGLLAHSIFFSQPAEISSAFPSLLSLPSFLKWSFPAFFSFPESKHEWYFRGSTSFF